MDTYTDYKQIANLSYDLIPRDAAHFMETKDASRTSEIRFVKIKGTENMYDALRLTTPIDPSLGDFSFVAAGTRRELSDLLSEVVSDTVKPSEIRVIRPQVEKDSYGVFVKAN